MKLSIPVYTVIISMCAEFANEFAPMGRKKIPHFYRELGPSQNLYETNMRQIPSVEGLLVWEGYGSHSLAIFPLPRPLNTPPPHIPCLPLQLPDLCNIYISHSPARSTNVSFPCLVMYRFSSSGSCISDSIFRVSIEWLLLDVSFTLLEPVWRLRSPGNRWDRKCNYNFFVCDSVFMCLFLGQVFLRVWSLVRSVLVHQNSVCYERGI